MGDLPQRHEATSPNRFVSYAERMGTTWPPAASFPEVLKRAKAHKRPEIGMLYRRFLPAVYRYVMARVADVATAEDLTSETFVAMLRGISSTRAEDELGFAAWLLGIARNQVLMHFRRVKVRPEVELLPQHEDLSQSVAEEGDPLLVLMAREAWTETASALETLSEDQRTVILYRCVLGYSTDEVASMMAKRPGNIRVLQFRALSTLTQLLGEGTPQSERRRRYGGR